jgi:hypothetical protein
VEQEVGGSSPPNCTTHRALDRANATIEASAVFSMTRLTDIRFSLPFSLPSFLANPSPVTHNSRSTASGGFAMAVRSRNFHVGLLLATALSVSMWPAASRAYTPEQEQACSGDAMRICGAFVPDVDRITVCMIQNKSQLSPGCRVFFRSGPETDVSAINVGRPMNIKPETSRKPKKSRKSDED